MGDSYAVPNPGDMYDNVGWGKFFARSMTNPQGALRTTAAISGPPQYVATSTSISDILQGTLNYRNPLAIANTVNVGLTKRLKELDTPGLTQYSLLGTGASNIGKAGSDGDSTAIDGINGPDSSEPTLAGFNTPEDMMYAGSYLANHPNFWIDTENMSKDGVITTDGSGNFAKNFKGQLLNGFTPDSSVVNKLVVYDKASNKAFIFPSLINVMYYIVDNGFILGRTTGFAGFKTVDGTPNGKVSQHAYGGAGDIHRVGRAKEGVTYEVSDPKSHPIIREIYLLLDQLPESRQPSEVGGPFEPVPGSKEDIYYTNSAHKDHLHIGFSPGKEGSLYSGLLPPERRIEFTSASRSVGPE
jgi:hypothetical protein